MANAVRAYSIPMRGALTRAVAALILGWLALRSVERVEVHGTSMLPTLWPGDRLLVRRRHRRLGRALQPGDLVVVPDPRTPDRPLVKRVVDVDRDRLTVRGDHAEASTDSRHWGTVPGAAVEGRAVYRYHPPSRRGRLR
jgi:nickel-type superoxide dismutase maturation protease